jgi:hypothetical protein
VITRIHPRLQQANSLLVVGTGAFGVAQQAHGAAVTHQGQRPVEHGLRRLQLRRQAVEVVHLALGELRHCLQLAEALQVAAEVVAEIAQQLFGLVAGFLRP